MVNYEYLLGKRVSVKWKGGQTFNGIFDYIGSTSQHQQRATKHRKIHVTYDDGDERMYSLYRSTAGTQKTGNNKKKGGIKVGTLCAVNSSKHIQMKNMYK